MAEPSLGSRSLGLGRYPGLHEETSSTKPTTPIPAEWHNAFNHITEEAEYEFEVILVYIVSSRFGRAT